MMKKGLLLIDRGSREQEVKDELEYLCYSLKERGDYACTEYCFLEVIPPTISDGIIKCLENNIDTLTIVPYFLYPGKKVKAAVTEAMNLQKNTQAKFFVTRLLNLHPTMIEIADDRIREALMNNHVDLASKDVDVLIVGHGSKDPNAKTALDYVREGLSQKYRNVTQCFLEIEEPNIRQGFDICEKNNPKILVVMIYFLHKGAHVKRDISDDMEPVLKKSKINKVVVTKHIGMDPKMIELVLKRADEVECTFLPKIMTEN